MGKALGIATNPRKCGGVDVFNGVPVGDPVCPRQDVLGQREGRLAAAAREERRHAGLEQRQQRPGAQLRRGELNIEVRM